MLRYATVVRNTSNSCRPIFTSFAMLNDLEFSRVVVFSLNFSDSCIVTWIAYLDNVWIFYEFPLSTDIKWQTDRRTDGRMMRRDLCGIAVTELLSFVDEVLGESTETLSNLMTWRAICRAYNLRYTSGTSWCLWRLRAITRKPCCRKETARCGVFFIHPMTLPPIVI